MPAVTGNKKKKTLLCKKTLTFSSLPTTEHFLKIIISIPLGILIIKIIGVNIIEPISLNIKY
jgi:hypothetical protein